MKIAVITPIYRTNRAWLEKCLASVRAQTIPCAHFVVSDGDEAITPSEYSGVELFRLPKPHEDAGNVARAIGSASAIARGFEAIAYLDADNWLEADHLRQLAALHQRTGAAVCTSARNLVDLDGQLLGRCPEVDGERFADTNTLFLTHAAFDVIAIWYLMPREFAAVGDQVVWKAVLDRKLKRAHSAAPTVNYRTNYRAHYDYFGKAPPQGAKSLHVKKNARGDFAGVESSSLGAIVPQSTDAHSGRRARVSLCMIVKNEEENLASCLGTVADLVDEMIVVDTGSTDRTSEVARELGASVYDVVWTDSFADARNESLRHASGDWIFWLDGDDRLDEANRAKLRRLFANLPQENIAFMMSQRSAPDEMTGTTLVVEQTRLFRKLTDVRWKCRVHEQILSGLQEHGARVARTDIVIDHLGYQTHAARLKKLDRNLRLLQLELKDNPHEPFALFNLANSYLDANQAEKAYRFIHRCLGHAPPNSLYVPKAYCILVDACRLLGRDDDALRHCCEGKKRFPDAAELWFREGTLLSTKGAFSEAQKCFEHLLALPANGINVGVDADLRGCRTRDQLAFVYRRLGLQHKAEEQWHIVLEQSPRFEKAWLALLEIYIEEKRHPEAESLLANLEGKECRDAIWPSLKARMMVAQGDIAGARQILEQAIARKPNVLWPRFVLSDILLRLTHDTMAAERHLRAILELAPNEIQARTRLNQLLTAQENPRSIN